MKQAPCKDIVRKPVVSALTVFRAHSANPHIAGEARLRVESPADGSDCRINNLTESLHQKQTQVIGLKTKPIFRKSA